jgi:C4-type Zn-finger protein
MLNEQVDPIFYAYSPDDALVCPQCRQPMSLTRRAPHADAQYEWQTFTCRRCGYESIRCACVDGQSPNAFRLSAVALSQSKRPPQS